MRSGQRRTRIAIQSVTVAQDATTGEPTRTYATLYQPWAGMQTAANGETLDGKRMQVAAETSHVFTIPYMDGVTRQQRVLLGSRPMEILSAIDPDNRRVELVLQCKEQV